MVRGLSPAAEGAALPGGDPPLLPGIIAQLRSAAADIGSHSWDMRCKGERQQTRDLPAQPHTILPDLTNSLSDILRRKVPRQSLREEGRR